MLTKTFLVIALAIVAMQAIRPTRENPPVDPAKTLFASRRVPPPVAASLTRACRDCHSSETVWPWYTNVAPVSWWIAHHVKEGRGEVSFSTWADQPVQRQARKLRQICKEVEDREMPTTSYVWAHSDADLTDDQRRAICDWTKAEVEALGPLPQESARRPRDRQPGD